MSDVNGWQVPNTASPVAAASEGEGRTTDIAGMVLRHKWIIAVFTMAGLGLGYLNHTKLLPYYSSSARLLVSKQARMSPVGRDSVDSSLISDPNYLKTQTVLIRSPNIIQQAIDLGDLKSLRSLAGSSNPVGIIAGGLSVSISLESNEILELSYTSADQEDCQKILAAVVSAYQKYLHDVSAVLSSDALTLITEAKDKLLVELDRKEKEFRQFRETSRLRFTGELGENVHKQRIPQLEGSRSQLLIDRSNVKAELDAVLQAERSGISRESILLMIEKTVESGSSGPARQSVDPRLAELEKLERDARKLSLARGAEHPDMLQLNEEIRIARRRLLETPSAETPIPLDFIAVYKESLRQRLSKVDGQLAEVDRLLNAEIDASKTLLAEELQQADLQASIERTERLFNEVVDSLQHAQLIPEGDRINATTILGPTPGGFRGPMLSKSLQLGGIGGLAVGLLIAFLVEMADHSFRSPQEISKNLGLPVLGHIPTLPVEMLERDYRNHPSGLHFSLCTYFMPRSQLAEAYRALRTALYFSTRGRGHQTIQLTSPDPGDGKSTVSANLAIAIAQSGKSCLLVDCDFRRPKVHKLFGLDRSIGITSAICGHVEPFDAIQSTPIPNLHCLAAGPRPENPSELLTSPRFEDMIEMLRDKYDFVLLDSPPMLVVSDPGAVAARADGLFLVMRMSRHARPHAMRCKELLDQIGANVLGVVVNGVGTLNGYSYTSGSRYGYGYVYGSDDFNSRNNPYATYGDQEDQDHVEIGLDRSADAEMVQAGTSKRRRRDQV